MSFVERLLVSSSSESDSEEDLSVCFGPYTLKEAKYDIKHMKPEKIHRRHSAFGKFSSLDSLKQTKTDCIIKSEEESILEQHSTSFLNHLASVIDEPSSSSTTSYYTAISNYDNTNTEFLEENSNKRSLLHQQSDAVIVISDSDSEYSESFSEDQHEPFIALPSRSSDSSESTNKADDDLLNDSLDAINRFLAEEDVQPRKLPLNRRSVSLDHLTVPNDVLLEQNTNTSSFLYQSKSAEKFHEKSKIPLFHKDTFKIPQKPSVIKIQGKSKKVDLKSVVSPVGMYIKYSPKYVSVIKPGECSKSRAQLFPASISQSSSKENLRLNDGIKIPTVIYKPAKTKILSETPGVKHLPGNIKKLMPKNTIIKHEKRTQQAVNSREIEAKLLFGELTLNDTDQFNEDISVLVNNKQPFH